MNPAIIEKWSSRASVHLLTEGYPSPEEKRPYPSNALNISQIVNQSLLKQHESQSPSPPQNSLKPIQRSVVQINPINLDEVLPDNPHSFKDLIKLLSVRRTPLQFHLPEIISNPRFDDLNRILSLARETYKSNSKLFSSLITTFFQHASCDTQGIFFSLLTLSDNRLLMKILNKLPDNMPYLNLSRCICLNGEHIQNSLSKFESLEHLNLSHCDRVNDHIIYNIIQNLISPTLTYLNLEGCSIRGNWIVNCLKNPNLINLTVLHLSINFYLADNEISDIINASFWEKIKTANFSNSKHLINHLIVELVDKKNLTNLTRLYLRDCKYLNDDTLIRIANAPLHINLLDLSFCTTITDAGIYALINSRFANELTHVDLWGCDKVSDAMRASINQLLQRNRY